MSDKTKTSLSHEAKVYALIALELIFGFLSALLLVGMIPGDTLDFNVLGSVVMFIPCAAIYYFASRYRKVIE